MDTTHKHKLIDGTFSPSDARQILLSLVKSKMDFHNIEKLSNEVRLGRDTANTEHRLAELKKLGETLKLLCESAAENGSQMRIHGWLDIELLPPRAVARLRTTF